MRRARAALLTTTLLLAACGGDDGGGEPDATPELDSDAAQQYLGELDDAGVRDDYQDDAAAVRFVKIACDNAAEVGTDVDTLLESGELNAQSRVALHYCDTELAD